ncbi:TPA: ISLre2 family transposase [Streptococcus agalactiae]|uniref:ISLre2 family transposase n=1 Tax=Streptococcus anginosus TaxID=1328 RepID=UPI002ABA9781|nr:ISLre2 family transposase [Streptococcus agalactiae]HEN9135905.1 ISLre2 family transposase [Streptococcus agalactiae]HEO4923511.1 ISLre2 family transposase [Streptococcus agalactiae]HEO8335409.1 ISLre2 family transposase [Streptococcus agalactiae]HEP2968785.1 ISLre2 family transposase [Streptococcus pyogenes]
MTTFDERELKEQLIAQNATNFYEFVSKYDEQMVPIMKARGYTCIHSMERTVAFTFGEFTFRRRRWKKGEQWVVPVDEKLGLEKNVRFSWEFMYQIAYLSTMMPYDKVVKAVQMVYHIVITKPTVVKAVKLCHHLLQEREGYRFFEEELPVDKKHVNVIFIEGDGVMVKARREELDNRNVDLSHFVVHTGSQKVGSNRFELQDKKEFISLDNRLTRDKVLDYLYNHFEIDEDTLLITNSDGGHGYTPYVFKEIAKALKVKRHEHFWDKYHVDQKLNSFFKLYSEELLDRAFQAIKQHDKGKLRTVLDTTEALILTEEELEVFESFKRKLLNNFQYTKSAELRGFSHAGIGVMESQHRKITYRMKKRGMYWTIQGAETMSQMIVLAYEGGLRELFFGSWREDYQQYIDLESFSAGKIKQEQNKIDKSYDVQSVGRLRYGKYRNL